MKKYQLLILFILLAIFGGSAYVIGEMRSNNYRQSEQEKLLQHLHGIIQAVDVQIIDKRYDKELGEAIGIRLQHQITKLEELNRGRRYYTLALESGQCRVRMSSAINKDYERGDRFQLEKEVEKAVFNNREPYVQEVFKGGHLVKIRAFVPISSALPNGPLLCAMFEQGVRTYLSKQAFLRKQAYVALAALALVIVAGVGFVFWRNNQLYSKRKFYGQIETIMVFFTGLWFVLVLGYIYREAKSKEQQLVFNNYGASSASMMRSAFHEVSSNIDQLGYFMANSESVDNEEFENYSRQLTKKGLFEELFLYEETNPMPENNPAKLYANKMGYYYPKYHLKNERSKGVSLLEKSVFVDSVNCLLSRVENERLIESTRFEGQSISELDDYIILGLKVPSGPSDGMHNLKQQFLVGAFKPQKILESSFRNADWVRQNLAIDFIKLDNGLHSSLLASFPSDHFHLYDIHDLDAHINSFKLIKSYALFIWDDFYVMKLHPLPDFETKVANSRIYLFYIIISTVALIAVLIAYFFRKYSVRLESMVETRTKSLDRRVRDLVCIRNITQMLLSGKKVSQNLENAASELERTLFPNQEAFVELHVNQEVYPAASANKGALEQASHNLFQNEAVVGVLKVKSNSAVSLLEEDHNLMAQIASKISNYLLSYEIMEALRDSEIKFRTLVENALDAIYMFADRRFISVNRGFCNMVGYSAEELTADDFDINILLTDKSKAIVEQQISDREKGIAIPQRYEFQQRAKNGTTVDVIASTVMVELRGKPVTIGMLHDITNRKMMETNLIRSEERLQQQNEELQVLNEELHETNEHIRQMNADLLEAKEKAEAGDKLKSAFLNNISHELRTPLNGILGAASMILDNEPDSPEERAEMEAVMTISTDRLVRTIEQYVDISMLTSGTMPFIVEKINLSQLVRPIVYHFSSLCKYKRLNFTCELLIDDAFSFSTDRNFIKKIVEHLLDNAVKFTHEGSVHMQLAMSGNGGVELKISDTGIGIQDEFKSKIYDLFLQQDISNVRRYDGSGLGLSIVKNLCNLMGATIEFESGVDKGSAFTVIFPALPEAKPVETHQTAQINAVAEGEFEKDLLLIAEDEDSNFAVLNTVLSKRLKLKILRAENGLEAVDICTKRSDISLCLMDIKMPLMDGYEATKLIKQLQPSLPIIAVTAFGLLDDDRKALAAGCDDYLAKPFQMNKLLEKVTYWLQVGRKNNK